MMSVLVSASSAVKSLTKKKITAAGPGSAAVKSLPSSVIKKTTGIGMN